MIHGRYSASRLVPVLLAAALATCGPATAPVKPESAPGSEFIDAKVSYFETGATAAKAPPPPKKVPMPQVAKSFDFAFPKVRKKVLGSGMGVVHVSHSRLPLVTIDIVFRAGSAYDPDGLPGLAVFVGEMLKGGTKTKTSKQVAEGFEKLGTDLDVWTSYDTTIISVTCLREHFDEVLGLLADIVINPAFPDDEIENLRARELSRLKLEMADPNWLAAREFASRVYGSHPYGRYDATEESIEKITRKDIEKFHAGSYGAANGFAAIVGDVDFKTAFAAAAKAFENLPKGKPTKMKKAKIPQQDKRQIVILDRPGSVETVFKIGAAAIERKGKDYPPLKVASTILGGSPSSRLFLRVREKESNAYGVGSFIGQTVDRGTWAVTGSTKTESTAKALESILDEIEKLGKEKAGDDELSGALSYLTGSFALRMETTDQVARLVTDMVTFGLPDGYWDSYFKALNAVSSDSVRAMTEKYLDPGRLVAILVGDGAAIKKLLGDGYDVTFVEAKEMKGKGSGTQP
jgi:zinc protease